MTNNQRPPARELPVTTLETIDLAALDDVNGGAINWKYQMYRAANAVSSWDPASVAAGFIM